VEALTAVSEGLLNHISLLLVATPLIGAVLVRATVKAGRESVWFTGLLNVWLSAALAVLLLVRFEAASDEAPHRSLHLVTSIGWIGSDSTASAAPATAETASSDTPEAASSETSPPVAAVTPRVLLAFGVTRPGLWPALLVAAAGVLAARMIPPDDPRLVSRMSWLLLTEAAMLGTFLAQDAVLLAVCAQVSTVGLYFLAGQSGSSERRAAARRFFRTHMASGLMLTVGLVALGVAHWFMNAAVTGEVSPVRFLLPEILRELPRLVVSSESAVAYWNVVSPWVFVLLTGAATVRLPVPPLHHAWVRLFEDGDRAAAILASAGFVTFPGYLITQIVLPLFPELQGSIGPRVFLWTLIAAVLLALSTLADMNPRRRLALAGTAGLCLALGFLFLGERTGPAASQLLSISVAGSLVLLLRLDGGNWSSSGSMSVPVVAASVTLPLETSVESAAWRSVVARLLRWMGVAGIMLLPLSGSFFGLLTLLPLVARRSATCSVAILAVVVLLSMSSGRMLRRGIPQTRADGAAEVDTRPPDYLLSLVPLVLILLTLICVPGFVTGSAERPPVSREAPVEAEGPVT